MNSFGITDIGRKRKTNQDYLFFSDEPVGCFPNLYIVADGMGGHKAGDKASSYAVTRFTELAKEAGEKLPFLTMEELVKQVNHEIFLLSQKEEQYSGMGTTIVAATVLNHKAYIMNIGDSRLYHWSRKGTLKQITLDHSLVEELIRAGELSRSESRNHPQKNIITRALGVSDSVVPDFFMEELEEGDTLLLCSDGLSNMVDDEKMNKILGSMETPQQAAELCVEEALFFGGLDNIAVVVAQYGEGGDNRD